MNLLLKTAFLIVSIVYCHSLYAQVKPATPGNEYEEFEDPTKTLKLPGDKTAVNRALAKDSWWRKSMETHKERIKWYEEARFGMFIHWGVYSRLNGIWEGKPVGGYAEQILRTKKIPADVYKREAIDKFNPVYFNADEWIRTAKETGMKYMIITAKHHDGFAMYPSDAYPYNIRLTPFRRDPMMELRTAARKYGIKFGFYYSHANDWEHPDASGKDWDTSGISVSSIMKGITDYSKYPELVPRVAKYVDNKAIPQLRELVAKYDPDIFWFDTNQHLPVSENLRMLETLRTFAPDVVVNGRMVSLPNFNFGDYLNTTDKPAYFRPQKQVWEGIPTTNESYGYSELDTKHKPASHFIGLLAGAANKGGNILMNVGPMGNGKMDPRDIAILNGIGDWMRVNGESIYGTTTSPLNPQSWGETTYKNGTVCLMVKQWPKDGKLVVGGFNVTVQKAYLLADKKQSALKTSPLNSTDLLVTVPKKAPDSSISVIVLKTSGKAVIDSTYLVNPENLNTLQAFDAKLNGNGLSYGGGKLHQQFVHHWQNADQSLAWKLRLNEAAKFSVKMEYNTQSEDEQGTVFIEVDGQKFPVNYKPTSSKSRVSRILDVGIITLAAGIHELTMKAGDHEGKYLLRPLNISLIPVK